MKRLLAQLEPEEEQIGPLGLDQLPNDCIQLLFTYCEHPLQTAVEWLQLCEALAQCSHRLLAIFHARCEPDDEVMARLFRCLFVRYKYASLGDSPMPLPLFLHIAQNELYCRLAKAASREMATLFNSLGMFMRNFGAYVNQGNFYSGSELYARLVDRMHLIALQDRLATAQLGLSQQLRFYLAHLHFASESRDWIDYRISDPTASSAFGSLHTYREPDAEYRQGHHWTEYKGTLYWLAGFEPLSERRSLQPDQQLFCIRERPMDNEASNLPNSAMRSEYIRKTLLANCSVVERWQRRQKHLAKLLGRMQAILSPVTCEEVEK